MPACYMDSALGFNDSEWRKALMVNSPGGAMSSKRSSFERMEAFDPVRIFKPNDNAHIYDFGQNASGIIKLRVRGKRTWGKIYSCELLIDSLVTQGFRGTVFLYLHTEGRGGRGLGPAFYILRIQVCPGWRSFPSCYGKEWRTAGS